MLGWQLIAELSSTISFGDLLKDCSQRIKYVSCKKMSTFFLSSLIFQASCLILRAQKDISALEEFKVSRAEGTSNDVKE